MNHDRLELFPFFYLLLRSVYDRIMGRFLVACLLACLLWFGRWMDGQRRSAVPRNFKIIFKVQRFETGLAVLSHCTPVAVLYLSYMHRAAFMHGSGAQSR